MNKSKTYKVEWEEKEVKEHKQLNIIYSKNPQNMNYSTCRLGIRLY